MKYLGMKNRRHKLLFAFGLCLGAGFLAQAKTISAKTEANVMVELTFKGARSHADPFNDVDLDAVFTDPSGRELRVPGFWDGTNTWKIRYSSPLTGKHRFRTESSDSRDQGLHGVTGTVEVKPYHGNNPALARGPLRLSGDRRYLEHADGSPFFWMGDTWWMGLCHRLQWPEEFKILTADRKKKGFNVIQIVTGLYPDMHPWDPRGANEAGFPWETNYTAIRPEYFHAVDARFQHLVDEGFTICIFGAWGHYISGMGVDKARQHWRYLIARYGAWPVVWSAAGEANLPWYMVKDFPFDDRKQAHDWMEVMRYIRTTDPFHRLLTVHPTGLHRMSSRNVTDDPALLDIDLLQTPHGMRDAVVETVKTVRQSYEDTPIMPVINGEAAYEMLTVAKGVIPTEWTRRMFWLCMMNGTAGHTYGANGIWQCNRKDHPHGASPPAGSPATGYGIVPWDEAMNFPGSSQECFGKQLFEQYPWQKFKPHPEWAQFVVKTSFPFGASQWIWFPEGNPAKDAPAAKRFFRRTFVLPEGKIIESARLRLTADDRFTASLNGRGIGSAANFKIGKLFNDLGRLLKSGTNTLAIMAENMPTEKENPAGLLGRLEIKFSDGQLFGLATDAEWRASTNGLTNWTSTAFDDSDWTNAMTLGKYGADPWKEVDESNNEGVNGPQTMGISGVMRIIYAPDSEEILVKDLGRRATYLVNRFDPFTGEKTAYSPIQADKDGSWRFSPPAGCQHDWVLILEAKSPAFYGRRDLASTSHARQSRE